MGRVLTLVLLFSTTLPEAFASEARWEPVRIEPAPPAIPMRQALPGQILKTRR